MADNKDPEKILPTEVGATEVSNDAAADSQDRRDRRSFLVNGLAAGVGAVAVGVAAAGTVNAAKDSAAAGRTAKSKLLARIQEELDSEYLDDPLQFHKGNGYMEYTKGS